MIPVAASTAFARRSAASRSQAAIRAEFSAAARAFFSRAISCGAQGCRLKSHRGLMRSSIYQQQPQAKVLQGVRWSRADLSQKHRHL